MYVSTINTSIAAVNTSEGWRICMHIPPDGKYRGYMQITGNSIPRSTKPCRMSRMCKHGSSSDIFGGGLINVASAVTMSQIEINDCEGDG